MDRWVGLVRRYGLAVLLTAGMTWIFFSATLPALKKHADVRGVKAIEKQRLEALERDVRYHEDWLEGLATDPLLRKRLMDTRILSPDVTGPHVVTDTDPEEP
jgi:hypothetical protein